MENLTPKQKRFCDEYLVDLNAKQAAIRAGYSKKTAESQGSTLLRNPKVTTYLQAKTKKIEDKLEISAERTLLEIARNAYTGAGAFFDNEGRLLQPHEMGPDAAACISGFEVEELWGFDGSLDGKTQIGVVKKIKRFDKGPMLDKLCKYFKLYSDTPPPPININLASLSSQELNGLLAIMKKMGSA